MKFTAIQGNLDTYMYYFRLLVVNLGTYYIFLKIINGQKNRLANIIKMFFIFLVTFINLYVNVVTNNLTGTMITLLLLIVLFDKVGYNTTSYTIISFGISNLIFFLSVMISGIPGVLFRVYNFNISLVIIITIYILLLFLVMKSKRIKYGFSFLTSKSKNDYFDFVMISLSVIILFLIVVLKNNDFLITERMGIFVIMFAIIMFITIKKSFQVYYKQKLLMKQLEEAENEIINKQKEIEKLEQENLNFSKKSHSMAHKQRALEYKLNHLLMKEETSKELEIKTEIEKLSKELYQIPIEDLPSTEITQIDDMLEFMQSECVKNKIDFNLQIIGNVYHIINNIITVEQLEILIADHIKDAIIAIKHTDNINKSILVKLGKIDGCYGLYIYDSGIEFEKETLKNLGKKPSTTHKDEGGTGMGFMNTFDTLNECKGSLIIKEIGKPSKDNFTKIIMIKFDGKNEYKVESYR
ncbi:MAG: hypothetical protein ACLR4X_01655 [Clostridia bacterium]